MALSARRRFEVLKALLGMAEEQGSVGLPDAASRLGVDVATLRSVLDPVLYLSFRSQSDGELIDEADAFSYDEDNETLSVDGAHWLRDMRSLPPSPISALELDLAGLVISQSSVRPDAVLDAALNKLEPLVNIDLSELFWVKALAMPLPKLWLIREAPGLIVVLLYLGLPIALALGPFRRFYLKMGAPRYYVGAYLFLTMLSLPIKMVLRWLFNLKYIVAIPEFFFNI